jgi:hypothetical protein
MEMSFPQNHLIMWLSFFMLHDLANGNELEEELMCKWFIAVCWAEIIELCFQEARVHVSSLIKQRSLTKRQQVCFRDKIVDSRWGYSW